MRRSEPTGLVLAGVAVVLASLFAPPAARAQQEAGDGPVSPDSADAIRAAMVRPPPEPSFDAADAAALPFKIVAFPLLLVGSGMAQMARWGSSLQPGIESLLGTLEGAGITPSVGLIGSRSGVAAQLRFHKLSPLFLETAFSIRRSQRHRVGLLVEKDGHLFQVAYTFQRLSEPEFWGVGSNTREGDRTDYLWDRQELAAVGRVSVAPFSVTAGAAFEDNRVARGFNGETKDIQDVPEFASLFGVRERTNYIRYDLSGALDLTHLAGLQRRGIYLQLGSSLFRGTDGTDSDFHRFTGSAHGYIPLNRRQALAVQTLAEINRGDGGGGVPFTHLASLGEERGARAFQRDRFRDRDLAAIMAEWRYEIWREVHENGRLEAFLFADEGGVARNLTDLDRSTLHESYGFGARAVWRGQLLGLAYLALGDEGARIQLFFTWAY